jgi:hypothetical protein
MDACGSPDLASHRACPASGRRRDTEVAAAHPLMRKLDAIKAAGGKVAEIKLSPLAQEHLEQLVADALRCELERAAPLAKLVHVKTGGNPFFAIQFLSSLVEEGLLTFDHDGARWSRDIDRIHAKGYTDNVVDLMVGKLTRLPTEAQNALQQLACLGNIAESTALREHAGACHPGTKWIAGNCPQTSARPSKLQFLWSARRPDKPHDCRSSGGRLWTATKCERFATFSHLAP